MLFPIEPFLVDILIGMGAVVGILAGRWGFEPIARPQRSVSLAVDLAVDLDADQRPIRGPRNRLLDRPYDSSSRQLPKRSHR